MTQYVRHVEKTGPIYQVVDGDSTLYPESFETKKFLLPRAEYRLCTEQGDWIPEWKDITAGCHIGWHAGLQRTVLMHGNQLVLHPSLMHRYRVTLVDYGIRVEERV